MRLFTAISIPEEIKDSIEKICFGLPLVRWLKREHMHITLCFIGEVKQNDLLLIEETLMEIRFPSFELELNGVGQFLSFRDANTLWIGVKNQEQISVLQSSIAKKLKSAGFSIEKRKYTPHLTLARIKGASINKIHEYMEEFSLFESRPFLVNSFQLFSSKLYSEGPVHTLEREFLLEGGTQAS